MPDTEEPAVPDAELSCYTANLLAYLAAEPGHAAGDAVADLAGSVRLAVRADTAAPAFSHHRYSLARMPDRTHLGYASAGRTAEAAEAIAAELSRYGRVLVVGNTAGVPWAPGFGSVHSVHWLLVDGQARGRWHVVDRFAALLPEGEQRCHAGWLSDRELAGALTPVGELAPERRARDVYAFGFPVPVPPATRVRWLARQPGPGPADRLPGTWLSGVDALDHLAGWFGARGEAARSAFDDVWTAGRHQCFRLDWQAGAGLLPLDRAEEAKAVWRQLVRSLRFALDSARRGRPRTSVIEQGFHAAAGLLGGAGVGETALERP